MDIVVVGTGYVGIVTGTCLAESGNRVICVDIDEEKIAIMEKGKVPIYEPHLESLLIRNLEAERISFTTDLEAAVKASPIVFLALPTPPGEDGSADLQYVLKVAEDLGDIIEDYTVVVDKSTVPVGTADKITEIIKSKTDVEFDVVSNPEFLREGYAVDDFMKPDRVVIGTENKKSENIMKELYRPLYLRETPLVSTSIQTSEIIKYASNSKTLFPTWLRFSIPLNSKSYILRNLKIL